MSAIVRSVKYWNMQTLFLSFELLKGNRKFRCVGDLWWHEYSDFTSNNTAKHFLRLHANTIKAMTLRGQVCALGLPDQSKVCVCKNGRTSVIHVRMCIVSNCYAFRWIRNKETFLIIKSRYLVQRIRFSIFSSKKTFDLDVFLRFYRNR